VKRQRVEELLAAVAAGDLSVAAAMDQLSLAPVESLPFASIDHHRALRQGYPEVVFGEGKTVEQVREIASRIAARGDGVLVTRLAEPVLAALVAVLPGAQGNVVARTLFIPPTAPQEPQRTPDGAGVIVVVTAGTSDIPVAEEAVVTLTAFGHRVERITDVGVAGIHRILAVGDRLMAASAIIVVAGMDGALPSVVGGLVRCPVIAVPTSVGYGAAFGGVAALLTMLNSCAAGVTVVNIDNGFGAAVAASRILSAAHAGSSVPNKEPQLV
jgi:pyridinium-3,5-biscarboxylic acid mononucleotide synthase